MATSSIGPVGGAVIDVQSLASQLVAAERQPYDAQISRDTTRVTTQISALGALKGALSTFQNSLSSLKTVGDFAARTAASSDPTVFSATATSSASPSAYNIEVTQLAKAQQLASGAFATGSTQVVGTGTLSLAVAGASFSITIDSTNSSLAGIRDAINAAPNNTGISAAIVQATDGAHLVLTSNQTGAANSITVAQAGGDGGLAVLAYNSGLTTNYTQIAPPQDAIIKVAGFEHHSTTNTVSDAIDGVTLNLASAKPGTQVSLNVAFDTSTAATKVQAFVAAYNALATQMSKLRSYDPTTKSAGAMLGDALLTGTEADLRRSISSPVAAAGTTFNTLSSIGIRTQADGTLAVDSAKLNAVLKNNFDAVSKLFGSTNGVAAGLDKTIDTRLQSGGAIDSRSTNLVRQQAQITQKQQDVDARMQALQTMYVQQFSSLNTLLSSLQTTSAYLTQQLSNLPKIGGNN